RAHSQWLAQQRSRCTHAVELHALNGLSLPLTFEVGEISLKRWNDDAIEKPVRMNSILRI
ncbi:hypothetical protein, partial [Rhizobium skierniewicense]|uniref:hypothetical protein n=1 Tax=Rhizobium skierniewicense TaxID=984260 RepID=UPI001AEEFF28